MARKTFISYKYSEARLVRDKIVEALGEDAVYYRGETCDSPDMTDLKTETIKDNLKGMLFDTSVTIVVISPTMTQSKWIDWEIEYSLREYTRNGKTSHTNGLVGVIMKADGGYNWLKTTVSKPDGHAVEYFDESYLYPIINNNICNQQPKKYFCQGCQSIDWLQGSYIALVDEGTFLADPSTYIENAYDKSQRLWNYNLCKTR